MTASAAHASPVFVGVDVAKKGWDVHLLPAGKSLKLAADEAGLATLVAELAPFQSALVVMEASGGYERELAAELVAAGHRVAVVNPRQVRDFARGVGILAKTDALDARVLAQFAMQAQLRLLENSRRSRANSMRW